MSGDNSGPDMGMLQSFSNAPPAQNDVDEGSVLSDQPPSDAGVIKPFGVHTFQSAPETLQSFGGSNAQEPVQPPPIALQQSSNAQEPPQPSPIALQQNTVG